MCEWSSSDFEGPSAYREQWRKARISHMCIECGGSIAPGTKYMFVSGVWDGRGDSHKRCAECHATLEAFMTAHDGNSPFIGALDEALEDCVREETSWDDDDNESVTDAGAQWKKALAEMEQRRLARITEIAREVQP